jgi:hypothetical protein
MRQVEPPPPPPTEAEIEAQRRLCEAAPNCLTSNEMEDLRNSAEPR